MLPEEIGVEDARKILGTLVSKAAINGTTTYLTRRGVRVAAITPLDDPNARERAASNAAHGLVEEI